VIEPGDQMDVVNLGRREAMQLKAGILRTQGSQKIFVPLDPEIRVQSALHQYTRAAERDRLVDLFANSIERLHVGIGRAGPPVERAERAHNIADIRVVDIAIDDIRDDVVGMSALADFVRGGAHRGYVIGLKERGAILDRQALAVEHAVENSANLGVRHRIKSSNLRNNTQSAASNKTLNLLRR